MNYFPNKKRILFLTIICGFTLWLTVTLGRIFTTTQTPAPSITLTISAAISLKNALQEIQTTYQTQRPNIHLTYNFGASGSLQQQIEQGAAVDLFISASPKQMDALQAKNLILPGTRHHLLSNKMVLITPKNEQMITKIPDLTSPSVTKIALGDPKSVPAGQYAEEVLNYYHIFNTIQPKIIYGKDVRQVLTYVETGNVNAGLVYATDASISNAVRIAATAPTQSHQPIIYPVAILQDSKNISESQVFLQFLLSQNSQVIFKKYGFTTS